MKVCFCLHYDTLIQNFNIQGTCEAGCEEGIKIRNSTPQETWCWWRC